MDERPRILVVEDDPSIGAQIVSGLLKQRLDATLAADGAEGAALGAEGSYDLAVLDLMLPSMSGWEVLEAWRARTSMPVIVLTAQTDLPARLRSFEAGAIDFIPKPFFMEELIARIRTRLRLEPEEQRRTLVFAGVVVDLDGRTVTRDGAPVDFTSHEFNLLAALVENPGRAVTRSWLADNALPLQGSRTDRTVDTHMSRIRKKLGPAAVCIKTVFAVGYRFEPGAAPAAER